MNKLKNILFRADSSSTIGTGHIMRDLVLAKQYPKANITFVTQELDGNINHKILEAGYELKNLKSNDIKELDNLIKKLDIDMLVIDHYSINYTFEKALKIQNLTLKIMVLDDTYEKHYCDILLNHNIYADEKKYKELVPDFCELRCGSKYTLLREEFIEARRKDKAQNKLFTILIAMGGSDIQNLNPKVLKALEYFDNIKVYIVSTDANPNLKELQEYSQNKHWIDICLNCDKVAELIHGSDLAIITPSVTSNEVYFTGLPFIAIKVADNQNFMVDFCHQNNIPVLEQFDENSLISYLIQSIPVKLKLINFIDLELDVKKTILEWRNNPSVRKWMFNKDIIFLDEHLDYIDSLSSRNDRVYFLVKNHNVNLGVIDFTNIDYSFKSAEIGLYSNPNLKYVGKILMNLIKKYGFNTLNLQTLKSNVFISNVNAIKLYKKFDFNELSQKNDLMYMELKNENR